MKFNSLIVKSILIISFHISFVNSYSQTLEDGIQLLKYQKNESSLKVLESQYRISPTNYLVKYWYSQSLIENQQIENAKNLYLSTQNTEQDIPFEKIIKAQIELLKANANLKYADQLFDSAISEAKSFDLKLRKKDKHIYINVIAAIGRANSQGGMNFGDANYAIKILNEGLEIDKTNTDIPIYLGICYQKIGGEAGSNAAKSYLESINRNNSNPIAYWHLGKIYQAQNNALSMSDYFSKTINAAPDYPIVYLSLFEYYKEKDINKAKENLDKYVQLADKDCSTDFYYADYLFRAGKYHESLDKANQMKNSACKDFELLPLLLAYNFERLNDSIQAKINIDYYFERIPVEKIDPANFSLAEKIYIKFPGSEIKLIDYVKRSYNYDTSSESKKNYAKVISNLYGKLKMYNDQYVWLTNYYALNHAALHEIDFYNLCKTALSANNIQDAIKNSKTYIDSFPLKPQGYSFFVRSARLNLSIDSVLGTDIYLNALTKQIDYLVSDTVKNKKQLLANYYNVMSLYANDKKDYKSAMKYCDKYLAISPFDEEMQKNRKKILEIVDKEENRSTKN